MSKSIVFVAVGGVIVLGGILVRGSRPVSQSSQLPAPIGWSAAADRAAPGGPAEASAATKQRVVAAYGNLPLLFEANRGQTDAQVKFVSRGGGYSLFLTGTEAVLALARPEEKERACDSEEALRPGSAQAARHKNLTAKDEAEMLRCAQHGAGKTQTEKRGPQEAKAARATVLRMKLTGSNPAPAVVGLEELSGKTNYFLGNDPNKWRTNVSTFAKVKYQRVYPGVDLVYHGTQGKLEYDFVVAPGADPGVIRLSFEGADRLELDAQGDLVLHTPAGEVREHKPVVHQDIDGGTRAITGSYVLHGKDEVGFAVAQYDTGKSLVIDPVLSYSTYLGGSGGDDALGITVDSAGSVYVIGETGSLNFPITPGAFQTTFGGGPSDAFVTKLNATGSALVYSTYLGGNMRDTNTGGVAAAIAVDSAGNAYVTGGTFSANFPITPGAFQTTLRGTSDAYVTKLNPTGSALVYSTYLGGSGEDNGRKIVVDAAGNAYVTGQTDSANFPTTPGAFQTTFGGGTCGVPPLTFPCRDGFVTKLNPTGTALAYSTYLGSNGDDRPRGLAVDSAGNAYVAGRTDSANFPTTPGAFQTTFGGSGTCGVPPDTFPCDDAFVTKLNPAGSALVYSTFLGGNSADAAFGIAVDSVGNAYVGGDTSSTNFPITPGAFQTTLLGPQNAFVTKLNATGTALVYSTYLGGSGGEIGGLGFVDSAGNAYVGGATISINFPITPDAFQTTFGGGTCGVPPRPCFDAFLTKLNATGTALVYSTYLGGSGDDTPFGGALDAAGNLYVAGLTSSTNFPTTPGAFQTTLRGPVNAFVVKIVNANTATALALSPNPSVFGQSVTFTATVTAVPPATGTPSGTVTFKDGITTLGTGTLSGGVATLTTASLVTGAHSITAEYGGNVSFSGSTSSALTQTVNKANTATTVASSVNPSVFGQSVTFTATVTAVAPGSGTPSGMVQFNIDGAPAGGPVMVVSGQAISSAVSTLSVGTHSITVVYGGDISFNGSASAALTQIVNKANTTATLASSLNPSVFGQSVTFTATATAVAPGAGTLTGIVTFNDGATPLGTGTLSGGVATFTTALLAVGTHSLTAVYGGDGSFNGSTSSPLTQTVTQPALRNTTTGVVSSANPSVFGQSVTFTATVTAVPPATGTPSGTVTFKDGITTLGTGTLSGGVATLTTASLAVGTHSITAVYGGDSNFNGSTSSALTQTVNKANTTTTVASSPNPSVFGQSVTFTATVSAVSPGVGTPSGVVTFMDGSSPLGTGTVNGGVATLTTASLAVGTHSITAVYGGDISFSGSTSSALTQTVNKANTTTTVVSSLNPSVFGQSVTFTATVSAVSPGAGTPSGTVTFKDGTTTLGTGTLSGGVATLATSALSLGAHSITAVYGGDSNFNGSASSALTQTANRAESAPVINGIPSGACVLEQPDQLVPRPINFYERVATLSATSAVGLTSFTVTGVSSEPRAPMDADDLDILISGSGLGPFTVDLRPERNDPPGVGTVGRTYTITAKATDNAGRSATAAFTCFVPVAQGSSN